MTRPEPQAKPTSGRVSADKSRAPSKPRAPRKTLSLTEATAAPAEPSTEIAVVALAPDIWPADVRAEFAKATPLWQQFMRSSMKGMEGGYTKRLQRLAAERKDVAEYHNRLRGYADRLAEIRGERVDIEAIEVIIGHLLEFAIAVEAAPLQQRPAVILDLAHRTYGLRLDDFAETIRAALHADATDIPADAPDRQAAGQAQVAQQEQQRFEAQTQAAVQAFADALDASGQPKHPYFAEVEDEMRDLAAVDVAKGLQPELGDLYSKAIRLNPVVSAKIAETYRRQAMTQRDADDRERVSRAKAASGSISGAGGGRA